MLVLFTRGTFAKANEIGKVYFLKAYYIVLVISYKIL